VGDGHEPVQGWPTNDGVKGEVDLHNVEDDPLRVIVLRRLEHDREGDATMWNDEAWAHT
jgi:hypothetical protein